MLQVSNIVVNFPNGKRLVNDVSFTVGRGEFVSILGSSGAGKSLTSALHRRTDQAERRRNQAHGPSGKPIAPRVSVRRSCAGHGAISA